MQLLIFKMRNIFLSLTTDGKVSMILSIIQIIIGILALIVAFWIPKKIEWEQRYSQLLSDYRSHDFGEAIFEIGRFFHEVCNNDVSNIEAEYIKRFKADYYPSNQLSTSKQTSSKLHYQRRLLSQFYWDLDQCAHSKFIRKNRIKKDFSSKEANLLKILYYLNLAAESPEVFMDLSCDDRLAPNAKSINVYIKDVYNLLKDSPSYIR